MTTILVTGGCGSIGSALVRRLLDDPSNVVRILSRNDSTQHELKNSLPALFRDRVRFILGDVRDKTTMQRAMSGVDRVFHCAAVKHVIGANYNADECVSVNAMGTANVLSAAHHEAHYTRRPITFVLLSTDKAADPSNVMGASKFAAEQIVMRASWCSDLVRRRVVRFGNVFDSRGSVFPTLVNRLKNCVRGEVTDLSSTRYIISIDSAARALLHASQSTSVLTTDDNTPFIIIPRMRACSLKTVTLKVIEHLGNIGITHAVGFDVIGLQPGEKMHEACITAHELNHVFDKVKTDNAEYYYVNDEITAPLDYEQKDELTALRSSYNAPDATRDDFILYTSLPQ